MRFQVALNRFSIHDVVETRVMVERWAAELAATRARAADLDAIAGAIRAMESPGLTPREFNDFDTEFHLAVGCAAHNDMVTYWMQAIREAVRHEMTLAFERLSDWQSTASRLIDEHRAIHEAIRSGDGREAARRVADHIMDFYSQVGMIDRPGP